MILSLKCKTYILNIKCIKSCIKFNNNLKYVVFINRTILISLLISHPDFMTANKINENTYCVCK